MSNYWQNWARTQRCWPQKIVEVRNENDVVGAVKRAAESGSTVRAAGSGHSFTRAVLTDGTLLNLHGLNRVLSVDEASGIVEVESGIVLRDLNELLSGHGLAMENLGDIDVQTISGAISTGTHGTGARLRNLSSQVAGVRLVDGKGEIVEIDDTEPDLLNAARVSLGALGVITAVKLHAVPQFTLERSDTTIALDEVLATMDDLAAAADHFEFFVFPYAKKVLAKTTNRTDAPPIPVGRAKRYLEDVILENRAFGAVCRLGRRFPSLIPRLNRLSTAVAGGTERRDLSHRIFATQRDVRFIEMEYCIERDGAADAIRSVMEMVERRKIAVNFPLEVRFVAGDDALLSPAHRRDSCYVAVHMYQGMTWEPYFRAVEEIMDAHGGRPHWGKWHFQTAETLEPKYPQWSRFQEIRERFDPDGTFLNDYTATVLGPVRAKISI